MQIALLTDLFSGLEVNENVNFFTKMNLSVITEALDFDYFFLNFLL